MNNTNETSTGSDDVLRNNNSNGVTSSKTARMTNLIIPHATTSSAIPTSVSISTRNAAHGNTISVSSPKCTVTRQFLNSKEVRSQLRKPKKDEEYRSFWEMLWPRLVKMGWSYEESNIIESANDGESGNHVPSFVFHDNTNESENRTFVGVAKLLEYAEKIPSLSYDLTQMVLAESQYEQESLSSSEENSESEGREEELKTSALQSCEEEEEDQLEDSSEDSNPKYYRPLASIPCEKWINAEILVKSSGVVGKIIRSASGWVTIQSKDSVFSKRAADLTLLKEGDNELMKHKEKDDETSSFKRKSNEKSLHGIKKKRKGTSLDMLSRIAAPSSSRRTVSKPVRYQDHAMLKKKKKRGRANAVSNGTNEQPKEVVSIHEPIEPISGGAILDNDDATTSSSTEDVLLSTLPQSDWTGYRVRILTGLCKGKIGVTHKVHYGWVHMNVEGGHEETCRRAYDLVVIAKYMMPSSPNESCGNTEITDDGVSMKTNGKGDDAASREDYRNDAEKQFPLLSSIPVEKWPGTIVRVKYRALSGRNVRVLRVNSGWVHLTLDLKSSLSKIEKYDACRRAFELEIIEEATPISDHDIINDVSQEEAVDYVDDSDISDEESSDPCDWPAPNTSPRHSCMRPSFSPGGGRPSVMRSGTENPYANKKIMIGSNYQVSNSSIPQVCEDESCIASQNERFEKLERNCCWTNKINISKEELNEFLAEFNISDFDWIMSLIVEGTREGISDIFDFVRAKVLQSRVGFLQLKERSHDLLVDRPKARRMLLPLNHKFHKSIKATTQAHNKNVERSLQVTIATACKKAGDNESYKKYMLPAWSKYL